MKPNEEKESTCAGPGTDVQRQTEDIDPGNSESQSGTTCVSTQEKVAHLKGQHYPLPKEGEVFGRLTVLSFSHRVLRHRYWRCLCKCGKETVTRGSRLHSGKTLSCGCLCREAIAAALTTHGDAAHGRTAEYRTWSSMIRRCECAKDANYAHYGGRGIYVCTRWRQSYSDFLADMGRQPSPQHSIDRINNDGNYEPGNCRWATKREQASNKRNNLKLTYLGRTENLSKWAEILRISRGTLDSRIKNKWPVEKILTTPARHYMHKC